MEKIYECWFFEEIEVQSESSKSTFFPFSFVLMSFDCSYEGPVSAFLVTVTKDASKSLEHKREGQVLARYHQIFFLKQDSMAICGYFTIKFASYLVVVRWYKIGQSGNWICLLLLWNSSHLLWAHQPDDFSGLAHFLSLCWDFPVLIGIFVGATTDLNGAHLSPVGIFVTYTMNQYCL